MQILVVVAIIQMRILKAEVEKGFAESELRRELLDPKTRRKRRDGEFFPQSKGNEINISQAGHGQSVATQASSETPARTPRRVFFSS